MGWDWLSLNSLTIRSPQSGANNSFIDDVSNCVCVNYWQLILLLLSQSLYDGMFYFVVIFVKIRKDRVEKRIANTVLVYSRVTM